jgi:hypothetical protein
MRPKLVLPLAGLLLLACIGFYAASDGKTPATTPPTTDDGLAVYFSPKGGWPSSRSRARSTRTRQLSVPLEII